MTIVLSLINQHQAIQLSDRLVSSRRGPLPGEVNKTTLLVTVDAQLAVGLSGLASVGTVDLTTWILGELVERSGPEYTALSIIQRLEASLNDLFQRDRQLASVSPEDRRLSLMFSGYLYNHEPPLGANCLLTNFQDFDSGRDSSGAWPLFKSFFASERVSPRRPSFTYVQRVGAWPAMYDDDALVLRQMLEDAKPARAIVQRGVALIRKMADRREAGRGIGKQMTSLVIPRDGRSQPWSDYHTATTVGTIPMPNAVFATGNGPSVAYRGIELTARNINTGEPVPLGYPQVGRNAPCPCRSGKKFKWCHGARRPAS